MQSTQWLSTAHNRLRRAGSIVEIAREVEKLKGEDEREVGRQVQRALLDQSRDRPGSRLTPSTTSRVGETVALVVHPPADRVRGLA